jgi:hypothetical protein
MMTGDAVSWAETLDKSPAFESKSKKSKNTFLIKKCKLLMPLKVIYT